MRPTTTTALALAGTALALPAGVALADTNDDPPSPTESALAAPFAGHLSMNAQMRAERREVLVERLTPQVIRTERKTARVKGVKFERRAHERRLRGDSPAELRDEAAPTAAASCASAKRAAAAAETGQAAAAGAAPAAPRGHRGLRVRRQPSAVEHRQRVLRRSTSSTRRHGQSVGGTGNPAAASEAEQDARAAMLYAQPGSSPWPVCGQ